MKKYVLALCVFLLLAGVIHPVKVSGLEAPGQPAFHDISGSYAKEAILRLAKRGIISGDGNGAFLPKNHISRAEFTAMLTRLLKLSPVNNDLSAFRDVRPAAWYYGYVHAGLNVSIVQGSGAYFYPNAQITRQEAAVMMVRAMKESGKGSGSSAWRYSDSGSIADWAWSAVGRATETRWLQGSEGRFRPQDPITREETAMLLDRVLRTGNVQSVLDRQEGASVRMGWLYNGTTSQYISYAKRAGLNVLVPRWYYLNSSGKLSDYTDTALLNWAHKNGRGVWAMIGNRSNAEMTHQILGSRALRQSVISSIADNTVKYKLDGINIDFENVMPQDRENLTLFVTQLSAEMKRLGAKLSIDVSPDLNSDWTAAFDYAALGRQLDYVVLMSYDEHWGGSPKAGSVSSLPWSESALKRLLTQIRASQAIVAFPLYTRDWKLASSVSSDDITLVEQGRRIRSLQAPISWNAEVGQYEAGYRSGGVQHRIWTEDARSLSVKHLMASAYQVAGFAYWYPGAETVDVWKAIPNAQRYASYSFYIQ